MDDCDIEPTPNDPEFDPYECESTYALWAFKEEGEPVKFLEASLVENPDCPSGYSFCWRTLSLCDRTGKLVDRFGGDIGDVSRADYIADTVLPGGAVSSQVEDDSLPNLPYSIAESTEAVPAFYRIDNPAMPDDPLTRDMLADALQSVENSHRSAAMDALLCNRHGMDVAKQALIASAARGMQSSGELFDMMSRAVGLIRATEGSAAGVGDYALAQSLLPPDSTICRTGVSIPSRATRQTPASWTPPKPPSSSPRSWNETPASRSMPRSRGNMPGTTAATPTRSYSPRPTWTNMPS